MWSGSGVKWEWNEGASEWNEAWVLGKVKLSIRFGIISVMVIKNSVLLLCRQ